MSDDSPAGHAPAPRTSEILAELAHSGEGDTVTIGAILSHFRTRAYGVLLMLALLPAFIPLPVGAGALSGPLVSLIGFQMVLTLRQPWLPQRARDRNIRRTTLTLFAKRMRRLLGSLERACKPRLAWLTRHTFAHVFTGVQLIFLGILLALPIPLTNYPFGLLLLFYAITIVERDGALLVVAWMLGCGAIVGSAFLSTEVMELVQRLWG